MVAARGTYLVDDSLDGRAPSLSPADERTRPVMSEGRKNTGVHEPTPGGWVDDPGQTGLRVRCVVWQKSGGSNDASLGRQQRSELSGRGHGCALQRGEP